MHLASRSYLISATWAKNGRSGRKCIFLLFQDTKELEKIHFLSPNFNTIRRKKERGWGQGQPWGVLCMPSVRPVVSEWWTLQALRWGTRCLWSEGPPHRYSGWHCVTYTNPQTISSKEGLYFLVGDEWSSLNHSSFISCLNLKWCQRVGFYPGEFISCEKLKSGLSASTHSPNPLNISS